MNETLEQILLENLAPLEAPATAIGWWPLGPGWWLLLALVAVAALGLAIWQWSCHRAARPLKTALADIQAAYQTWQSRADTGHYLQAVNHTLRRLALQRDGRTQVAALTGDNWTRYLQRRHPDLSPQLAEALTAGAYSAHPSALIEELHPQVLDLASALHRRQRHA